MGEARSRTRKRRGIKGRWWGGKGEKIDMQLAGDAVANLWLLVFVSSDFTLQPFFGLVIPSLTLL